MGRRALKEPIEVKAVNHQQRGGQPANKRNKSGSKRHDASKVGYMTDAVGSKRRETKKLAVQ